MAKCKTLTGLPVKGLTLCSYFILSVVITITTRNSSSSSSSNPMVNNHPMGCEAQLADLKMRTRAHFFRRAILTRNVDQTDLVFGVRSGFISRSVRARLQVSVCCGFVPPKVARSRWPSG